ncbi:MAG: hypothetical protein ACYDA2_11075 [Acidimicrobiales bacterium]
MPDSSSMPGRVPPDPTGKVRVGFFSFTEITDPSEHRAYNEWHQLDHMPEQFPLPGIAGGERWVSTPALRAARAVDGPLLAPVHYVTLYLMTEPVAETLVAFAELGADLARVGRFHQHRRALLAGAFDAVSASAAARVLVSAPAVPFRPDTGVYVVVEDAPSPDATPDAELLAVDGVAGVWRFTARPPDAASRYDGGGRRVTVCWLDGDPLAVSAVLGPHVARPGVSFAGGFAAITPWQWDWFDEA